MKKPGAEDLYRVFYFRSGLFNPKYGLETLKAYCLDLFHKKGLNGQKWC